MSRSGLVEGDDDWSNIRWRGVVASATRGARGQRLLRDLLAALDSLPGKRLVRGSLQTTGGDVCALGAVALARGVEVVPADVDPGDEDAGCLDFDYLGKALDVAPCLAQVIVWENDEVSCHHVEEVRCGECHGWGEVLWDFRLWRCGRCVRGRVKTHVEDTPERRWSRVRAWVVARLRPLSPGEKVASWAR